MYNSTEYIKMIYGILLVGGNYTNSTNSTNSTVEILSSPPLNYYLSTIAIIISAIIIVPMFMCYCYHCAKGNCY